MRLKGTKMEKEKIVSVGGQAVIEGVMMKSPEGIATAVRRKDGQIVYRKKTISKSNAKLMKIPFIRNKLRFLACSIVDRLSKKKKLEPNWSATLCF